MSRTTPRTSLTLYFASGLLLRLRVTHGSWKQYWGQSSIGSAISGGGPLKHHGLEMACWGMHSYERSLTQHELSISLLSLSPAIDVRSQTHSQDVAPILVGTMTTRILRQRIQPEPQPGTGTSCVQQQQSTRMVNSSSRPQPQSPFLARKLSEIAPTEKLLS